MRWHFPTSPRSPPHTHAALALAAIAAGKHVICEKPFARDAAEGHTVLAAAEAAGIVHLLGTEFRWDPGQATLARAAGSRGTAWSEGVGSKVLVADAGGTRVVPVGEDLPTDPPEPLPDGLVHTAYDRMIAHGMDLAPYTRLATAFRELMLGRPLPA